MTTNAEPRQAVLAKGGTAPRVFWPATILIVVFVLVALLAPGWLHSVLGNAHRTVINGLGWYYVLLATGVVGFGLYVGFFQQDAAAFADVARSTGLVERIPGTAWRRHPLAFLVEVADDTCYLIVDLEDAARLGFVAYRDAEWLLADLAGNAISARRLDRLHDPKERLEYLRAKACLLYTSRCV